MLLSRRLGLREIADPAIVEQRELTRHILLGKKLRELEDGIAGEVATQFRDDFLVMTVLSHDANSIQVLLDEEVDMIEGVGHASDRQRRSDQNGRRPSASENTENGFGLERLAQPCPAGGELVRHCYLYVK